jgi:hypothetical protein
LSGERRVVLHAASATKALAVRLYYDPDNSIIVFQRGTSTVTRAAIQAVIDRPFIATETVSAAMTFQYPSPNYGLFRECLYRGNWISEPATQHTARAPTEFEVTLTGVAAGSGDYGDQYAYFNDTFVLTALGSNSITGIPSSSYSFTASHANYYSIQIVLSIYHDIATGLCKATLFVYLEQADDANRQCVRFYTVFSCACTYDWRTFESSGPYGDDTNILPYLASHCWAGTPFGGSGPSSTLCSDDDSDPGYPGFCTIGADFSKAVASVVPVP